MTAVQWYHARGTEQFGPVSAGELKQLAQSGRLKPDDLVWREGMADWAPARTVRGLFDADVAAPPKATGTSPAEGDATDALPVRSAKPPAAGRAPAAPPADFSGATAAGRPGPADTAPVDSASADAHWSAAERHAGSLVLRALGNAIPAAAVASAARWLAAVGHYAMYAAMLAVLVFGALVTIKTREAGRAIEAVAAVVLLLALQYAARRLFEPLARLAVGADGAALPAALAHATAWLALLAGPAMLLTSIAGAVASGELLLALGGLAGMIVWWFVAAVALHPEALGLEVRSTARIEHEALGAAWFLLKLAARTVHAVFGVGTVAAMLVLAYACVELPLVEAWPVAVLRAAVAESALLALAALPPAAYLALLFGVLLVRVAQAILERPGSAGEEA